MPRPLRRPPAIILDDSEENKDESEGKYSSYRTWMAITNNSNYKKDEEPEEDEDVDKDAPSDEGESNADLQELSSVSLKQRMASEVRNSF